MGMKHNHLLQGKKSITRLQKQHAEESIWTYEGWNKSEFLDIEYGGTSWLDTSNNVVRRM